MMRMNGLRVLQRLTNQPGRMTAFRQPVHDVGGPLRVGERLQSDALTRPEADTDWERGDLPLVSNAGRP